MFKMKPLPYAVHSALSTLAIATVATGTPGMAQAQQASKLEEVVVTGSRIATDPNVVTSSPVTTIRAEEVSMRGVTRVEDLINTLPSVLPEFTGYESNGAVGSATIDLRGLTSDRTLVLTNGHRMGFGDVFQLAPDINQVPGALIDRVEVLTGGASATYGSDAMAGVVNFIMKRDFEGVQVDYQYSAFQHDQGKDAVQADLAASGFEQAPDSVWDGGTHNINLTFGVNSPDGRGNITGYLGYRSINAVKQSERDFSACALSSRSGTGCSGSATRPDGTFTPFDGSYYYTVAGDQFVPWDYTYYNYGPLNFFQRPDERYTAGMFGHYEINEHLEGYTEFQFMDDRTNAQIAPSGDFFTAPLPTDPLQPPMLDCDRAALLSAQEYAAIGCAPGTAVPMYIGRRNVEGGPRNDDIRHTSYRILIGARGEINDTWSYDAFANFSKMILSERYNNDLSTTRINRALQTVVDTRAGSATLGQIVCYSVIDQSDPNCVPWDIWHSGGVTQDQIDYLSISLFERAEMSQQQYSGYVTGDLGNYGFKFPMADDGVKVVLGGEYRDEKMDFQPDENYQAGDASGQGGGIAAVEGGLDVTEFFFEAKIPIAQNQDWIESLSLDIGYRYSDYSVGVSTDTYKFMGEWTPVSGIKIRGGYNRAVRVANLREFFEPYNLQLWSGDDPCAGGTPTQTAAECANSGVTAAQYGNIPPSPAGQYNTIGGGDTTLQPEKSNSFTVGAVLTPEQIPGLTLSVDYWSIRINNAIHQVEPEYIVRTCGETGDPYYCDNVHRSPVNGNLWIGSTLFVSPYVFSPNVNIGYFDTSGIDIAANYGMDVGSYGSLSFAFRGTWTEKADQLLAKGATATVDHCAGTYGGSCQRATPDWSHNFSTTWVTPWNLVVDGTWRYIGGVDHFQRPDRYSASAQHYFDLSAEYTPTFIDIGETTLRFGINNVLDNDPPVSGFFQNVSVFGNGNTIPGLWDTLGRYFFFGITQKF